MRNTTKAAALAAITIASAGLGTAALSAPALAEVTDAALSAGSSAGEQGVTGFEAPAADGAASADAPAFSLSDWTYREENGEVLLVQYKGTASSVVIPGEVEGKQVRFARSPYQALLTTTVKKVSFSVVNGRKAKGHTGADGTEANSFHFLFNSCTGLEVVDLTNLDFTDVENFTSMFGDCKKVKSIVWPDNIRDITSKVTNASSMFDGCESLVSLDFAKDWDMSSLTKAANMFQGCTSLTDTSPIKAWDVSSLEGAYGMFNGCSSLTKIDLGQWKLDGSKFVDAGNMFTGTGAGLIDLSGWDLSTSSGAGTTSFQQAFETGSNSLTVISKDEAVKNADFSGLKNNNVPLAVISLYDGTGDGQTPWKTYETYVINGLDDASIEAQIDALAKPTRQGYTFIGWQAEQVNTTTGTDLEIALRKLGAKRVARWRTNTYTIHFDANGGGGTMADQAMSWGQTSKLVSNAYTRPGFTFAGWKVVNDGGTTSAALADGAEVSNLADVDGATVTLQAQWTQDPKPVTPAPKPETPVTPVPKPDTPVTPEEPSDPGTPDTPANPDTPVEPDTPETPDASGSDGKPDGDDAPGEPGDAKGDQGDGEAAGDGAVALPQTGDNGGASLALGLGALGSALVLASSLVLRSGERR